MHYRFQAVTDIGFDVVSNTLDGHSANRKFYKEKLCNGVLQPCIPHPYKWGSWIFLPFDSVHVFKCTYNNLVNRKKFICPPWDGQKVEADVGYLQQLYDHELGRPLKYAHKLNDKVLHPMPIEKTNVQLADRFYHESTIHAMEYYSEPDPDTGNAIFPQWKSTVLYLKIIRTWWNIVNIKNPKFGRRKRDPVREPISIDDPGGIQWLHKFLKWVLKWQEQAKQIGFGLTNETFFTIIQTTRGLIGVCMYLLEEKGLDYVLPRYINSDPIERRYGWYRQLCGKY